MRPRMRDMIMTMASNKEEINAAVTPSMVTAPVTWDMTKTPPKPTITAAQPSQPTRSFKRGTDKAVTKIVVAKEMAVASPRGKTTQDQYRKNSCQKPIKPRVSCKVRLLVCSRFFCPVRRA